MLLAGGQGSRLYALTKDVAKPSVPFGGKYRIIDFPLSNCANSGIDVVGVLTQYRPLQLNSYIGSGQAYDLDSSDGGVFILPPYQSAGEKGSWFSGTANAIYQNMAFIETYDPENVLILSGDHIYKMDYSKVLKEHVDNQADATIAVRSVPMEEAHRFGIMNTNERGDIIEFEEKPKNPKSNKASMGIYIFSWPVLKQYLIADAKDPNSENDFGKNIIPNMLNAGCKMHAYEFNDYWKDVGTVQSLWEANMDILSHPPLLDLSSRLDKNKPWRIYSKSPIMPPHCVGKDASIIDSLVTEGCEVMGSVHHSILFAGCTVEEDATVDDCVLMPGAHVKKGAVLRKAIVGENSIVGEGAQVGADRLPSDGDYDTALTGDITLIASGTEIADHSRVPVGMIVNTGIYGRSKEA